MIKIISHRGYWFNLNEKNQKIAFKRSWDCGFGIETDIRDFNLNLVISHDMASYDCLVIDDFFNFYKENGKNLPLALNIKSDNLSILLKEKIDKFQIDNYFFFDMSVPDTLNYLKSNMIFYSRQSELEINPILYQTTHGIWLDAFESEWYSLDIINTHLINGKNVSIVSPELHNREHLKLWSLLKKSKLHLKENIMLCTDFPLEAQNFFYEK
jgi:hypothetical protein